MFRVVSVVSRCASILRVSFCLPGCSLRALIYTFNSVNLSEQCVISAHSGSRLPWHAPEYRLVYSEHQPVRMVRRPFPRNKYATRQLTGALAISRKRTRTRGTRQPGTFGLSPSPSSFTAFAVLLWRKQGCLRGCCLFGGVSLILRTVVQPLCSELFGSRG